METIFDKSRHGRSAHNLDPTPDFEQEWIPENMRGSGILLPEVDELTLVRHYTGLSKLNFSVDANFYPLGSCTMKYNPKINEQAASLEGFSSLHPLLEPDLSQGILQLMHELARMLGEIAGFPAVTLQPAAGAHGELTGLMIASAWFEKNGERDSRNEILIPDSAHGTNPASASLCGYTAKEIKSDSRGLVDINDFRKKLTGNTALMMITNPNTLGLFEEQIQDIADELHNNGSLLYMDGANLNAIMGIARPGDFGADIMHFNLHKTFSTPHGGGGPGSGPVGVTEELEPFIPFPVIKEQNGAFVLDSDRPDSIGRVRSFYGNTAVMVRAYVYLKTLGGEGFRRVSENAVLNANYLRARMKEDFDIPFSTDRMCMHEFVVSAENLKKKHGITALDIAKGLIDRGIHPPTVYFPLIIPEALMIEPTETESIEALDRFAETMKEIAEQGIKDPDSLRNAPHSTHVSRPDEVAAARDPVLRQDIS